MLEFVLAGRADQKRLADFEGEAILQAHHALTGWRTRHARPLSKVAANLRYHVAKEGGFVDRRIDVAQRLKRRPTIIDKLRREPTMEVTQMEDIGGVRARLPSLGHVHAVSRRLRKTWTIHRTRDYIANPKPSGYRALHHTVIRDGVKVEVQLRTLLQDAWANQVEDDGRHTGVGFKFGSGQAEVHAYYVVMSEVFAFVDAETEIPAVLIADLNRRYASIKGILPGR
jgi:putative GTP pyrophosphokinase